MKTKVRERKNLSNDRNENLREGTKIWTEYWRKNIEIFVDEVLGIKLFPFQMIIIHMMHVSRLFVWIACRGLGKSFITAVYCCAVAILYPGIKIVIASGQKTQADAVITEKISELIMMSPVIAKATGGERGIVSRNNKVACYFKNGSKITSVASNQGARG